GARQAGGEASPGRTNDGAGELHGGGAGSWEAVSSGLIAPGLLGDLQLLLGFLQQIRGTVGRFWNGSAPPHAHADIAQHRRTWMMDSEFPDSFGHLLADAHRLLRRQARGKG